MISLFLYPKETPGESIEIRIERLYALDGSEYHGLWNTDTNDVFLCSSAYNEFNSIQSQAEKRKFFNGLTKVVKLPLGKSILDYDAPLMLPLEIKIKPTYYISL
jgi:hypothetical protein